MADTRVTDRLRQHRPARSHTPISHRGSSHPVRRLQNLVGNGATARLLASLRVQAKLSVSDPDDTYEHEADEVASQVLRIVGLHPNSHGTDGPAIQRQEEEEEEMMLRTAAPIPQLQRMSEEELEEEWVSARRHMPVPTVQRQEEEELVWARDAAPVPSAATGSGSVVGTPGSLEATSDVSSRLDAGRGGGQALDRGLTASMGRAFGYDFSDVRVHAETSADDLAGRLQAEAFTHGRDVYFRSGRYQPDSETGRFLLAHELTHVVQQGAAAPLDREAEE